MKIVYFLRRLGLPWFLSPALLLFLTFTSKLIPSLLGSASLLFLTLMGEFFSPLGFRQCFSTS